jgi:hypothetical protein
LISLTIGTKNADRSQQMKGQYSQMVIIIFRRYSPSSNLGNQSSSDEEEEDDDDDDDEEEAGDSISPNSLPSLIERQGSGPDPFLLSSSFLLTFPL